MLTTLVGDPDPSRGDLRIEFEDYAPRTPVVYSEDAARSGAGTTAVWLALALLFPCYLAVRAVGERAKGWRHLLRAPVRVGRRGKIVTWCVAIDLGLVAGVVDYATADVVETRTRPYLPHGQARQLIEAPASADMEAARAVAADFWRGETNPYDGREVREEPSPGNYGLELRNGRIMYILYDAHGTPLGHNDW